MKVVNKMTLFQKIIILILVALGIVMFFTWRSDRKVDECIMLMNKVKTEEDARFFRQSECSEILMKHFGIKKIP